MKNFFIVNNEHFNKLTHALSLHIRLNNITTKKSGKSGSELSVGQYVKYEPSGASTTYPSEEAHNGYGLQNISQETLNWRVLSVDGNSVKIISDVSSTNMTYKGAVGYNNVVKDLNDMCKTLYSHGTTEARSVNLDDFSNKSQISRNDSNPVTCPAIYPQEKIAGGSLEQSEQHQWVTGNTTNTNKMAGDSWSVTVESINPLRTGTRYLLSSREI